MQTENALGAQRGRYAGVPTGLRKLTPGLLQVDRAAEAFDGLPGGITVHGQLLAAFKAAAPSLGLALRHVHAIDWLFKFTQPQDWGRGGRPIVWPSASLQQDAFGLSDTRVKALNRELIEAGLVTMRDSPNGKRYGRRDPKTRLISEAYGFDLSPIAGRHAEFVQLAEEAKAERVDMGRLRRRATIARNGITQILETAAEYNFEGEEWSNLRRDSSNLTQALRRVERLEELALGVESLERRQREARERLEMLLAALAAQASEAVNPDPKGAENGPHQYTYKPDPYPREDTVMASKECKSPRGPVRSDAVPQGEQQGEQQGKEETQTGPRSEGPNGRIGKPDPATGQGNEQRTLLPRRTETPRTDGGTVVRLSTDELMQLAPRLRTYLQSPRPAWSEIVDAADWLRGELGVSQSLWGEACVVMGREQAAIAIAIVSAKPPEHFRSTRGRYFHGMVAKARAGELNLARTVWGLRQAVAPKSHRSAAGRAEGLRSSARTWR